jgi:hypothetical protein
MSTDTFLPHFSQYNTMIKGQFYFNVTTTQTSKREANWIGHILCRNCLLWQVIEGKIKGEIEVTGR